MRRSSLFLAALLVGGLAFAAPLSAQDAGQWRPATTQMPQMPTMAQLQGGWEAALGGWFGGVERASGVAMSGLRATGTARSGSPRAQVARFMNGPIPVVMLTDRNGDDRADMIEIFRGGTMVLQVIDADYNGQANVMRVYDASGALVREEKL